MKKLFLKILILSFGLFVCQIVVARPIEPPEAFELFEQRLKKENDIIFFGDSSHTFGAINDKSKASLTFLLKDLSKNPKIMQIDDAAFHAEIYYDFMKLMIKRGERPKLVIVPVNLRSLSKGWINKKGWQFTKLRNVLNFSDTIGMKFIHPLSVFKWGEHKLETKKRNFIEFVDVDDEKIGLMLKSHYIYSLDQQNRRMKDFVKLAKLLDEHNIPAIFYVTPIDVQSADQYYGKDFRPQIDQNIKVFQELVESYDSVKFLNYYNILKTEHFSWVHDENELYPNEHMAQKGRMILVYRLNQEMQQMLR